MSMTDMNRRDAIKSVAVAGVASAAIPRDVGAAEIDGNKLVGEFDARVWAEQFMIRVRRNPSIATDEGCMLAWFANAIMSGYDRRSHELDEH